MELADKIDTEATRPVMSVRRRFGIRPLMVAMVVVAMVLGFLRFLTIPPYGIAAMFVFLVAVAVAQAFYRGGRKPRQASVVAGAIVLPIVALTGVVLYAPGPDARLMFQIGVAAVPMGAVFGYLLGALLGSAFSMFETGVTAETLGSVPHPDPLPAGEGDLQGPPVARRRRWWLVPLVTILVLTWIAAGWRLYQLHLDLAAEEERHRAEEEADSPIFDRVERAARQIERLGGKVPDREPRSYGRCRTVVLTGWQGKDADLALLRDFVDLVNVRQLHYRGMKTYAADTTLSDDAIPRLVELRDILVLLDIRKTRITAKGVKQLQVSLPYCKVLD